MTDVVCEVESVRLNDRGSDCDTERKEVTESVTVSGLDNVLETLNELLPSPDQETLDESSGVKESVTSNGAVIVVNETVSETLSITDREPCVSDNERL